MDELFDDSRNALRAERRDKAPCPRQRHTWFGWAGRHPGVVLLGAVIMAIIAIPDPPSVHEVEDDSTGEEVPLFI
jgi:hypothetical protein